MSVNAEFDQRTRRVVRKHRAMNLRGVTHRVGRDGLIISRPKRRKFHAMRLILPVVLLGFAFKGYLYNQLGAEDYAARVAALADGNTAEQVGAVLMQPEAVTRWAAAQFAILLN
ncbi:MAG: Protein of unknown function (DUF1335) [Rhodobacteraceae bacterium HLUCCA08]|nr:MAG: Protein of unknown function (DUF1335) [Rhodobacteraceae bacterium HLUCCA08]